MNIQTDTGTINLSDIQADHLTVHTDTGSIHVGHFQGKDIHLETDTGPIEVEKGEGDIRFKTDTGSIRAGLQHIGHSIDMETDTGSIQVDHVDGADTTQTGSQSLIHLKTNTGSIKLKFSAIPSAASFNLSSDTGRVSLLVPGVDFDEKEKHHASGDLGTGGPEVQATSDTGSIEVSAGP
jgi:DUF4097 and DUF4098 domain-containing protein YvlB